MQLAMIGCGYVADLYVETMKTYPELELACVYDVDKERLRRFTQFYNLTSAHSLEEVLGNENIEIVLNLTNPRSHYSISRACLEAGKHVYSEKPLAMDLKDASELVELAEQKGLLIVSAPCNALSESAQTMWNAIRKGSIGNIYAVYAEMDDGMVHRMPYRNWFSKSGNPWPSKDEFEVGCSLEHSAYVLTWLCMFFGPATNITAFGATTIKDKKTDESLNLISPDLSVGCVRFSSGVIARITCSIVASQNHRLRIYGEEGVLGTDDFWNYHSVIWSRKRYTIRRRLVESPLKRIHRLKAKSNTGIRTGGTTYMDFSRGPAEMASSLIEKRTCRLSSRFSLHINELALVLHEATISGISREIKSTFEDIAPMN